jgi:outer membrane protein assembly factor BamE (lipoprotein component of BamABCDE complex)
MLRFNSKRASVAVMLALCLAGCGVETAGTAATVASMKAKEIKQGRETKEQIVKQLDEANRAEAQGHKDAENK